MTADSREGAPLDGRPKGTADKTWATLLKETPASYEQISRVDRRLVEGLPLRNLSVLNVACGARDTTERFLLQQGSRVTSLDREMDLLRVLCGKIRHERFSAILGDATRLPFTDASFDLVCAFSSIEHIQDPGDRLQAFRELARVSKRYVAVTVPNLLFLPALLHKFPIFEYRYTPRELRCLLQGIHLRILKFDSETASVVDDSMISEHAPYLNPAVAKVLILPLRLMNRIRCLKPFGTRMGFLAEKSGI